MLQPKRTKYRKQMKGRNRGLATRGNNVSFGEFGLKATTRGRLTARQIEAARRALTHYKGGGGGVGSRVFPNRRGTKTPRKGGRGGGRERGNFGGPVFPPDK